jgi:transcriptional regulator with XRE-family HTH domain
MNIKKVIKEHGWTLERIASEMGISQPSVSSIVNGNPTLDKLQAIARIIGVPVSTLLADEDEPVRPFKCPHCGADILITLD